MHAIRLLETWLKRNCSFIHPRRRGTVSKLIDGLVRGEKSTLTHLGRSLNTDAYEKHNIKCVDRLMGNERLWTERKGVYRSIAHWLLSTVERPWIIVDWSDVELGHEYLMLKATVPVGGRALSIYEEVHPLKHYNSPKTPSGVSRGTARSGARELSSHHHQRCWLSRSVVRGSGVVRLGLDWSSAQHGEVLSATINDLAAHSFAVLQSHETGAFARSPLVFQAPSLWLLPPSVQVTQSWTGRPAQTPTREPPEPTGAKARARPVVAGDFAFAEAVVGPTGRESIREADANRGDVSGPEEPSMGLRVAVCALAFYTAVGELTVSYDFGDACDVVDWTSGHHEGIGETLSGQHNHRAHGVVDVFPR